MGSTEGIIRIESQKVSVNRIHYPAEEKWRT
jgi:hypothetical protein